MGDIDVLALVAIMIMIGGNVVGEWQRRSVLRSNEKNMKSNRETGEMCRLHCEELNRFVREMQERRGVSKPLYVSRGGDA